MSDLYDLDSMLSSLSDDLSRHEDVFRDALSGFCDRCGDPVIDSVPLEHFGARCALEQRICAPGSGGEKCYRNQEFGKVSRALEEIKSLIEQVELLRGFGDI